ncbi:MAG: HXXEE domain-containing protein [Spirochaetes bacterium]|nr:HXXEE domain-containing protein [Spirochaetota bacterium]
MADIIQKLNAVQYKKIIWILAISETLHNVEEAVWLPGASYAVGKFSYSVGIFEFRFAIVLLTLVIYGVIYYFTKSDSRMAGYIMGGVLVAILVNVFVPHIAGVIATGGYSPGVITGIFLNIPVALYLLRRGVKENYYTIKILVMAGLVFQIIGVLLIQLTLFIGRLVQGIIN